jgi:hypothetical protein
VKLFDGIVRRYIAPPSESSRSHGSGMGEIGDDEQNQAQGGIISIISIQQSQSFDIPSP